MDYLIYDTDKTDYLLEKILLYLHLKLYVQQNSKLNRLKCKTKK